MEDEDFTITNDGKTVAFSFDTAWAPPTEWYDNIEGFYIKAYYYEPGVGFCGTWISEDGDDQYQVDLDDNIETVTENIPSDILDKFGIIDDMLAMQDDEELGNIDDAEDGDENDE